MSVSGKAPRRKALNASLATPTSLVAVASAILAFASFPAQAQDQTVLAQISITTTEVAPGGVQIGEEELERTNPVDIKDVFEKDTSVHVVGGSVVGVLGPNGSGKSTLLKALAGVLGFDGTARLDGEPIDHMPRYKRSALIGYLPQDLPPPSTFVAYEVVITACKAARPDLSAAQVAEAARHAFGRLGLNGLAFRPLSRMSGGQRQLVGLTQVLVREPRLFLLDEPTSALDLKWQSVVFGLLRELVRLRNAACLVAMHDINLVLRYCDQVAVIGNGAFRAFGPPEEAITSDVLLDIYQVDGQVEASSSGARMIYVAGAL